MGPARPMHGGPVGAMHRARLASPRAGHGPICAGRGLGSRVLNPDSTTDIFGVCLETPVSGPLPQERGGDRGAGSDCF